MSSNPNFAIKPSINEILTNMDYGPVIESDSAVKEWLSKHKFQFGIFLNGTWHKKENSEVFETFNKCTGESLASLIQAEKSDVNDIVTSAKNAFTNWYQISADSRSRYLYSIARHLQKHQNLFTILESIDTGRAIHEIKNFDIPQVIRCFYYHSGWAELKDKELKEWKPLGVVSIILPWNFPLLYLVSVVAPAIAMGNTVIVKPASKTPLSALLFAEICNEAGLPAGVYNVITGAGGSVGKFLATHPEVNKIAFIGSVNVGKQLRSDSAGLNKHLSVQLGGKSSMIVFDSSDQDSVIEGIVDGLFFNQGQICTAASQLLIQETVFESVIIKLKARLKTLRIGNSLDKCIDLGSLICENSVAKIKEIVEEAKKEKAQIYQVVDKIPMQGNYYPPTLITKINPGIRAAMEEIFGPVIIAMPFRIAKEAIAMANNSAFGTAVSVWARDLAVSLEVAKSVCVSTVWINCHNLFDATATPLCGCRLSGFGYQNGKQGLYSFLQPIWKTSPVIVNEVVDKFALSPQNNVPTYENIKIQQTDELDVNKIPSVDQTYKIYVGGIQKRPDSNSSRTVCNSEGKILGQIPECNRKDVRDAVEAAHKAQTGWSKRSGYQRSQILYFLAENLQKRSDEFVKYLMMGLCCTEKEAKNEVETSIQRLFYWGSYCDKYGGIIQETNTYGTTQQICEAVGVIGIICPKTSPLLSFVSLMSVAICRGNAIIIVPNETFSIICLNMCQVLGTSDVPAGVVNILTGSSDHIARQLAEHHDINAVWYFGSNTGSKMVEQLSSCNMKRTWVDNGVVRDWYDTEQGQGEEFLHHATHFKTIWMPMGEIFAN